MKKWRFVLAACVVALAGCAHFDRESCRQCGVDGFDPRSVRPPQPLLPNVFVTDRGQLVVDQEPIRVGRREVQDGMVVITWALSAKSKDTFADRGIVIAAGPSTAPTCVPEGSKGKLFKCSFKLPEKEQVKYKYTVNVLLEGKTPQSLDPNIEGSY